MDNFEVVLPHLRKIALFSDFSKDCDKNNQILKAVYDNISIKEFSKGDTIIKEGDFGEDFFILYDGTVLVERKTPAGDKIALAKLSSDMNVFFGETALISNDARTATVKAATACKTIVLTKSNFEKISDVEPGFGYKVVLEIARRMAATIKTTNSDKATLYEALFNEIEGLQ